jgi:hypothetical protein
MIMDNPIYLAIVNGDLNTFQEYVANHENIASEINIFDENKKQVPCI